MNNLKTIPVRPVADLLGEHKNPGGNSQAYNCDRPLLLNNYKN